MELTLREQVAASLKAVEPTPQGLQGLLVFAADLPVFAGHFPGAPLVPGIFLIENMRLTVERVLGVELLLDVIVDARFTAPIGPEGRVAFDASITEEDGGWSVRAHCEHMETSAAKLRLCFRAGAR